MGLSGLLTDLGPALAVGAAASLVLVIVIKILGTRIGVVPAGVWSWGVLIAAPVVVGAAWAVVRARRNWPTAIAAASQLDAVSGLADVLGSAMIYASHDHVAGFEAMTLDRARGELSRIEVHEVAPLRLTRPWSWAAVGVVLAGVGAAYAPVVPPPDIRPVGIARARPPVEVQQAAEQIDSAKETIKEAVNAGVASE